MGDVHVLVFYPHLHLCRTLGKWPSHIKDTVRAVDLHKRTGIDIAGSELSDNGNTHKPGLAQCAFIAGGRFGYSKRQGIALAQCGGSAVAGVPELLAVLCPGFPHLPVLPPLLEIGVGELRRGAGGEGHFVACLAVAYSAYHV